jgi:hypothetical protein
MDLAAEGTAGEENGGSFIGWRVGCAFGRRGDRGPGKTAVPSLVGASGAHLAAEGTAGREMAVPSSVGAWDAQREGRPGFAHPDEDDEPGSGGEERDHPDRRGDPSGVRKDPGDDGTRGEAQIAP